MTRTAERYKKIPIGIIIKKDLRQRRMSQKELARIIGISYGSLNHAINGRRLFNVEEGDRIDSFFQYESGFVISVQLSNESERRANKMANDHQISPPRIRSCVFWDTTLNQLDWIRHRKFITERVAVYGNEEEKQAVEEYYRDLNKCQK